jgi:hypothetical protein
MKKMLEKVAYNSAIRVILSLFVGLFVGLKFPEGVQVACTVADVLAIEIDLCKNASM